MANKLHHFHAHSCTIQSLTNCTVELFAQRNETKTKQLKQFQNCFKTVSVSFHCADSFSHSTNRITCWRKKL